MRRNTGTNSEPIDRVLVHDSRHIPYRLHLSKRRGLRISVTPALVVNVFAPSRAPQGWIEDAIRDKATWIAKTLDRIESCEILVVPENFEPGTELRYLGRSYRLVIVEGSCETQPELLFDSLLVSLPELNDGSAVKRAVVRWYRTRAREEFQDALARCLPKIFHKGVTRPALTIRNMRSRWGSCSSTGRINLNLKLVMLPETLIDYVMMHELCHLVHHDHSKRYYALLSQCMPDWRIRKKELNRYRMI